MPRVHYSYNVDMLSDTWRHTHFIPQEELKVSLLNLIAFALSNIKEQCVCVFTSGKTCKTLSSCSPEFVLSLTAM